MNLHRPIKFTFLIVFLVLSSAAHAQQTNSVDKQIANPITDQPDVSPVAPQQDIKAPKRKPDSVDKPKLADDEVEVTSNKQTVDGEDGKRIVVHSGNVDARYGVYRMQADKITVYEAEGRMVAEGSVVFDQGDDQRITGTKGEFNYRTKLGYFVETTGFTNQTNDGTVLYLSLIHI